MDQGPKAEGLVWPCPLGGRSYRRLLHPCALLHGQEGDSRKPSLSPQEHEPVSTWASTFRTAWPLGTKSANPGGKSLNF